MKTKKPKLDPMWKKAVFHMPKVDPKWYAMALAEAARKAKRLKTP